MTLTQLIYYSQPFGFDDAMLDGILLQQPMIGLAI